MGATGISDERRLFERFPACFPAKFKDTRADFGEDVQLRDISASGARFLSKERFFLHDRIAVEVKLPDNSQPLALQGEVVWQKFINASMWEIGIAFSQVKFLGLHRLIRYASHA